MVEIRLIGMDDFLKFLANHMSIHSTFSNKLSVFHMSNEKGRIGVLVKIGMSETITVSIICPINEDIMKRIKECADEYDIDVDLYTGAVYVI